MAAFKEALHSHLVSAIDIIVVLLNSSLLDALIALSIGEKRIYLLFFALFASQGLLVFLSVCLYYD